MASVSNLVTQLEGLPYPSPLSLIDTFPLEINLCGLRLGLDPVGPRLPSEKEFRNKGGLF